MAGDKRTGPAQCPHDMRELLFRPVGAQNLVKAEQVSRIRPLLELVGIPRKPDADLGLVRVARGANTGTSRHVRPATAQVRKDVLESVERVFNTIFGGESANIDLANPCVCGVKGTDDHVIQMLSPTTEEVRKSFAIHTSKTLSVNVTAGRCTR